MNVDGPLMSLDYLSGIMLLVESNPANIAFGFLKNLGGLPLPNFDR